jgi:hypothetical protein
VEGTLSEGRQALQCSSNVKDVPYECRPACLTFHTHDAGFFFQQNCAFVGRVSEAKDGAIMFGVERVLGTWSLAGGKLATTFDLLFRKRRRLRPRLKAEAARRGQAVPKVRFPGEERRSRSPRVVDQEPSGPGPLGSH